MRPYQWEPLPEPPRIRRDWSPLVWLVLPWLALALADYLGI